MFHVIFPCKVATDEQKMAKKRVMDMRRKKPALTEDDKEEFVNHKAKYGQTREPLLANLTSDFDLNLFRQAQARACEDLVSHLRLNNIFLRKVIMFSWNIDVLLSSESLFYLGSDNDFS